MMRLLPIIIVVSILGLLLVILLIAYVCHCWRSSARRKRISIATNDLSLPRQLTVRHGKVIPVSEIVSTVIASQLHSPDVGTVRPGSMLKSKFWKTGVLPPTAATATFLDRCRSSPSPDLEAQSEGSKTRELSMGLLRQLEEQLWEPRSALDGKFAEDGNGPPASRRKITTSLKKAYKGAPILETVTIEIPSAPFSRATTIRTLARNQTRRASVGKSSRAGGTADRSSDLTHAEKFRKDRPISQPSLQDIPADAIGLAISTDSIQWDSPVFLDSHHASFPTIPVVPTESAGTFVSDGSTTWTIANARAVPIFSSVALPAAARVASRMPRSKYRRYSRVNHEKALPTIPRPP